MPIKISEKPTKTVAGVEYYDTFSVSRILKIDPHTIRDYFKKNYFRGVKLGRNWYLSKENLEFFIVNGKLKTRDNMTFEDYKIIEAGFLTKIKAKLKKAKEQIEQYQGIRSAYANANLKRRHEQIKQALEVYEKNKMTKKDFDTFI